MIVNRKGVNTIVIQYKILHEQCIKLDTLSFNDLAENLHDASSNAISKPAISLQKSRLVLGDILFELYKIEMHTEPRLKNIRTLLNNKDFVSRIHPRRVYLLMNLVHKMTNGGSNDVIEAKVAKIVLDYVSDIVEWFIKRYDRSFKSAVAVQTHSPIEDIMPPFAINVLSSDDQPTEDYERAASWFELSAAKDNASA